MAKTCPVCDEEMTPRTKGFVRWYVCKECDHESETENIVRVGTKSTPKRKPVCTKTRKMILC